MATDRTINRDGRRPMVGSIVASCDRSCEHSWCGRVHDQLWHPTVDRRSIGWVQPSIARSIVASCDRSLRPTTDRTINRGTKRPIVRSIVASCDRPYDQSCDFRSAIIHNWWCHHGTTGGRAYDHVRPICRPLTIWNRRLLRVLNMTIDPVKLQFILP